MNRLSEEQSGNLAIEDNHQPAQTHQRPSARPPTKSHSLALTRGRYHRSKVVAIPSDAKIEISSEGGEGQLSLQPIGLEQRQNLEKPGTDQMKIKIARQLGVCFVFPLLHRTLQCPEKNAPRSFAIRRIKRVLCPLHRIGFFVTLYPSPTALKFEPGRSSVAFPPIGAAGDEVGFVMLVRCLSADRAKHNLTVRLYGLAFPRGVKGLSDQKV